MFVYQVEKQEKHTFYGFKYCHSETVQTELNVSCHPQLNGCRAYFCTNANSCTVTYLARRQSKCKNLTVTAFHFSMAGDDVGLTLHDDNSIRNI